MKPNPLTSTLSKPVSRCGFHYFPDTLHYRESDLVTWLPELQRSGTGWLVLRTELDRAIPEGFLRGLKSVQIEPLIQFQLGFDHLNRLKEVETLLEVYARWGARYVILFDKPNARASWPAAGWVQQDLVERFLDHYLPIANLAAGLGLAPVFPPLEPGGSYWDTAFLRSALEAIQRRRQNTILNNLVLSAYAWTAGRPLDWGIGGSKNWPIARPYQAAGESQDQRGFRIFDWYQSVAQSVLQQTYPMILLQAGLPDEPSTLSPEDTLLPAYTTDCASIARMAYGQPVPNNQSENKLVSELPPEVIACNFWLLSAEPSSAFAPQAWYQTDGRRHELVGILQKGWREQKERFVAAAKTPSTEGHSIQHYLLLPGSEWGVSDWYLEVIRPFVKKYRPTIGFSPDEAGQAERVTVVGNTFNYPADLVDRLQRAGCIVEQIGGDGTNIASLLAER